MKILLLMFFGAQVWGADPSVFRMRLVEDPGHLDWNNGETSYEIVYQLMEGLFRLNEKGQAVKALAQDFEWNKKRREVKIHLLKGLKWSDGQELCAQDFVRSWNRLRDKKFASSYAHYAVPLLQSVKAENCHTLVLRTQRFAPELPELLAHWVFFPLRQEHTKSGAFKPGRKLLVNGPYQVIEWVREQKMVLEKNPYYQNADEKLLAKVDRIEFLFLGEDNTALAMYDGGRLDAMKDLSPLLRQERFRKSGELRVFPALIAYYLGLNATKSKLLQDEKIRRALAETLDRQELSKILGEEVRPASRWIPDEVLKRKTFRGSTGNPSLWKEASAKLLLAASSGALDIKLRVYNKPAHKTLAEWAQGQWLKKLGVTIPIEVVEEKVYWGEIASNTPPIFLSGVTAPYNHPRAFLQEFFTGGSANWLGWSSDLYDMTVKDEKYVRAEDILLESGHVIPLYTRGNLLLIKGMWKNFWVNPLGIFYLQNLR